MDIKIGSLYVNQTKRFLLPLVKHYGNDFFHSINHLYKLAVGVGDYVLESCGLDYDKHLYILVDVKATNNFLTLLNYFQKHPSYQTDYPFDIVHKGHMHMIVIKIPSVYIGAVEKFKESKYSEMFSKGQIDILFTLQDERKDILLKNESYRIKFIEKIAQEFDVKIETITLDSNAELDLPIVDIKEIFNQKLKK